MGHDNLRSYLKALEEKNLLNVIKSKVNKDTELMPLVRWQFRGLPADQRKGFLFENVTDSKGREYKSKVAVGVIASSRKLSSEVLGCQENEVYDKWLQGLETPVKPRLVEDGPVKEVIHSQEEVDAEGLDEFPIPISTPGFDPAPYLTAPFWVTKDLETGIRNVGTYRGMVKGKNCTGVGLLPAQHITIHWEQCKAKGKNLEAAVVIGGPPAVALCSASKVPYGIDEFEVAGGLMGKSIDLIKCETVDLEVPASAEIVLEGEITTDYLESEGPFGEFTGYVGKQGMKPVFKIKCITHRKNPIYHAFISQFPPSESTGVRGLGHEANLLRHLKRTMSYVKEVCFHETGGAWGYCVIQIKKGNPWEPKQVLCEAAGFAATLGKIFVVVDDDIDPRDPGSVNWAMSFRMQPARDIQILNGRISMLDPSSAPPGTPIKEAQYPGTQGNSALLIDATRKWSYPPVSLPAKEYMEKARIIWEKEGLPQLNPVRPWFGYTLGNWTEEEERLAQEAVKGNY